MLSKDEKSESNLSFDSDSDSSSEESKLLSHAKKKDPEETKDPYPKSIFFIVGNEFCERFSFYGMRTILLIYLTRRLYYDDDTATIIYHSFVMLAYFTPLFGALIADSWLGKFRTILYISILYAAGNIVVSAASFPNELNIMVALTVTGLLIIAIGTGGIKPCVSAFGGDQFNERQERQQEKFFSFFYLAINLGSVFGTLLSPIMREDVQCLGEKSCFPLAFGVPAGLMCISIILFITGKPFYVIKPPEGNIMTRVAGCICHAIGRKCKSKSSEKKKEHWLDYADDKYEKELISDIKILFHVLILYIPLPIFWCLFDQSGSRWTIQATALDGNFFGVYFIKADQMQSINPILIVLFIPLFEYIVYPILNKFKILQKPLQRITVGGLLAAVAFMLAGLLQTEIEKDIPTELIPGYSELTMINNSPCVIKFTGLTSSTNISSIDPFQSIVHAEIPDNTYATKFTAENCSSSTPIDFSYNASSERSSIMITLHNDMLLVLQDKETKEKAKSGEPMLKIYYNLDISKAENISFKLTSENEKDVYIPIESNNPSGRTSYKTMLPAKYKVFAPLTKTTYDDVPLAEIDMKSGGIYILSIYNKTNEDKQFGTFELVKGNHINILLQIPQYAVITAGEILLSITGLEFSYSQAPTSMKSVVQACWLMTVAFGNLIMMIITEAQIFKPLSHELFFFSVLMAADMVIFAILAYFYKYVGKEKSHSGSIGNNKTKGRSNDGYEEETDFNK